MKFSLVIPCYNEAANVAPMVARLDATLAGIAWEAIFVDDDSPDGTSAAVRAIAAQDADARHLALCFHATNGGKLIKAGTVFSL